MDKVKMARMWNIIREVASARPDYCSCPGMFGYATCMFCTPTNEVESQHASDCVVLQARALVEQEYEGEK